MSDSFTGKGPDQLFTPFSSRLPRKTPMWLQSNFELNYCPQSQRLALAGCISPFRHCEGSLQSLDTMTPKEATLPETSIADGAKGSNRYKDGLDPNLETVTDEFGDPSVCTRGQDRRAMT